jgi:hypothetical protein
MRDRIYQDELVPPHTNEALGLLILSCIENASAQDLMKIREAGLHPFVTDASKLKLVGLACDGCSKYIHSSDGNLTIYWDSFVINLNIRIRL